MKDKKVLLLYPPEQTWPNMMCKPNGSLAYPNLAGTLLQAGIQTAIYDACVGNDDDVLEDVFYNNHEILPTGMIRTGVKNDRILEIVSGYDIIGITSIFTHQETMVLDVAQLIKAKYPEKILVSGGVNAKYRSEKFFTAGFDYICTSEAEFTFKELVLAIQANKSKSEIANIKFLMMKDNNNILYTGKGRVVYNLDDIPIPAWHLLPNNRYWKIGRPHGGKFKEGTELKYASMVTSMGCPFACSYCHISHETKDSISGEIGKFRIKSIERVVAELEVLRSLGVKQIFVEDDSIFGKKKRAIELLKEISNSGFDILDVNGVNIIHLLKHGEPDLEVLTLLKSAGFTEIVLPFESSSPRIIKKYASNKWDIKNSNIPALIDVCKDLGFRVAGNFMLGYPDETMDEVEDTLKYAEKCMDVGLDASNFFLVMPLPGTKLFDYAVANNHLEKDFNPDRMHWQKANMKNTTISPEELEKIRDRAWEKTNKDEFINYKKNMVVDMNTGEIRSGKV